MSLLFMDGFEYKSDNNKDDMIGKWSQGNVASQHDAVTGRGGSGLAIELSTNSNAIAARTFPQSQDMIFGFGWRHSLQSTGTRVLCNFNNSEEISPIQMQLGVGLNGIMFIKRGGVGDGLAVSSKTLHVDTWYHFEIKIHIENSPNGTMEIKVDGSSVGWIDFTGDTHNVGSATINVIQFQGNALNHIIDDFVLLDTSGSRLNDFIGDTRIETIYPTGVGNDSAWTPLAGTNWEAVDEVVPDEDTTYVHATAAGTEDRHAHGNLASAPDTVHAVAVNLMAERQEAGNRFLRALAHDGVAEGISAIDLPTGLGQYQWHQAIYEDHPAGAAVWTAAEVDAGEFGYRINT